MVFTNNLKSQYDLPVWQPLAPAPVATAAGSATCTADDGSNKYLYYLVGQTFFRWSSETNGWQQLASAPAATSISVALKYSKYAGHRSTVLSATNSTVTLGSCNPSLFLNKTIRIISGTGAGQDRTITGIVKNKVFDKGLATTITATTSISSMQDTARNWMPNQWIGYEMKITYNSGATITRKIIYNDNNTLYFFDPNYQQLKPWENIGLYTAQPYTLPVTTAGSQPHYTIESAEFTINSNWTVNPDTTSKFAILSGGIFALTSATAAPWSTFYYYDCLTDTWMTKTALGGHLLAGMVGDWSLERTGEVGGTFVDTQSVTSATTKTITNSGASMSVDRYVNHQLRIVAGTGIGQRRRIIANSATTITLATAFDVTPDATSKYSILGNVNVMYLSGNNQASMYQYNVEEDIWSTGNVYDIGTARQGAVKIPNQEGIAITSGAKNTGAISTVVVDNGGTGYYVGDILTITTGGTGGKVRVTGTSSAGVITSVSIVSLGATYTTGTAKATSGGNGTSATMNITAITTVGKITTAIAHNFILGQTVTLSGATDALWNGNFTIIGIDSTTTFEINTTAAGAWAASNAQSATQIVDSTANWATNEHAGKVVHIQTAGPSPTHQSRRITSNTATTLVFASIVAPTNGTSRYVIQDPKTLGRGSQYPQEGFGANGYATSGSTTTLVDSTKTWLPGQWVGYKFRIVSGTGINNEITITANDATTLTYTTQTFTPDTTTKYEIMDTYGLCTSGTTTALNDTAKKWRTNQFAGKRCKIIAGTGAGQEFSITSNTATQLVMSAITTAPDASSVYVILDTEIKGGGSTINWIFGNSDATTKGKYLGCFFGGAFGAAYSHIYGRYDITTELWDLIVITSPNGEMLTTGSSYAYSGKDRIYYQVVSTGRMGYIDVNTHNVEAIQQVWQAPLGSAIAGNRLEIITTVDNVDFLVLMDNTGQRMWRSMVQF